LIKEEGFYVFGGQLSDGSASNELWILKSEKDSLRWVKGNSLVQGIGPRPRYSHSITYYEKENSLLITGGRNDRGKVIYSDAYFLTRDTLTWIKIDIRGPGMIGRADHFTLWDGDIEFVIFGGIDYNY
jgi:hypothetical protein